MAIRLFGTAAVTNQWHASNWWYLTVGEVGRVCLQNKNFLYYIRSLEKISFVFPMVGLQILLTGLPVQRSNDAASFTACTGLLLIA